MRIAITLITILGCVSMIVNMEAYEVHGQPSQPQVSSTCDPFISGLASLAIPGWGQMLNSDPQRKSIIHFSIGLGSTLVMIYRWGTQEGNIARTVRILWSFVSGMEAFGTCYSIERI